MYGRTRVTRVVLLLGALGGFGVVVLALGWLSGCSGGFAFWSVGGFGSAVLALGCCALWWLCSGRLRAKRLEFDLVHSSLVVFVTASERSSLFFAF